MKTAIAFALALLAAPTLAAAQATAARPAPTDLIGALIEQHGGAEIDEDTAENLGAAPARPGISLAPPATPGYAPAYARPVPSGIDRPVMLHETGVSPDGPPGQAELTYESRVRGSIAAAQGLQGPLDGAWTLSDAAGAKLYAFQMVDPRGGGGVLEGAWRDLRRGQGIGGVGLIDTVERGAQSLILRFQLRESADPVVAVLTPTAAGGWSGQLTEKGVQSEVSLTRDFPATTSYATLGVGASTRPYDPTPRAVAKAPVKKKVVPKKKPAPKKKVVAKKPAAKAPVLRKG